jgi:cap2 methyltransferase
MCEQFKIEYSDSIFISDIRTADFELMKMDEHEQTIQKDNLLQANWVKILQPLKAMLKFRCPYFKKENSNFIRMLSGEIFFQPWAPHSSTETRLICDPQSAWKQYEVQKYENQMFYHNDVVRIEEKFKFFIWEK